MGFDADQNFGTTLGVVPFRRKIYYLNRVKHLLLLMISLEVKALRLRIILSHLLFKKVEAALETHYLLL